MVLWIEKNRNCGQREKKQEILVGSSNDVLNECDKGSVIGIGMRKGRPY